MNIMNIIGNNIKFWRENWKWSKHEKRLYCIL